MPIITKANPFRAADTYKQGHWEMYPPDYRGGEAYAEGRKGRELTRMRFVGIQAYVKKYMMQPWTVEDYDQAAPRQARIGAPLNPAFRILAEEFGERCALPLTIYALPEGMVVPAGTPLYKVRTRDPRFASFANWLETQIRNWAPTTVASIGYEIRENLQQVYKRTGADESFIPFAFHDFGPRGVADGAAGVLGMGHLLNFRGSDNSEAMEFIETYYGSDYVADTVLADEHNVTISWGKHRRKEYIEYICGTFGRRPGCMFSHVMDTWNQDEEFDIFSEGDIKQLVLDTFGTTPGCKLIWRPDSGKPVENVTKYPRQMITSYGNVSESQHAKLPNFLGLMQGDSMDRQEVHSCLFSMELAGLRPDNAAFGSGGGNLQKINRDMGGFAQKQNLGFFEVTETSYETGYGITETFIKEIGTAKVPLSDPSKRSKEGDLAVWLDQDGNVCNGTWDEKPADAEDLLRPVWDQGELLVDENWETIQARA